MCRMPQLYKQQILFHTCKIDGSMEGFVVAKTVETELVVPNEVYVTTQNLVVLHHLAKKIRAPNLLLETLSIYFSETATTP